MGGGGGALFINRGGDGGGGGGGLSKWYFGGIAMAIFYPPWVCLIQNPKENHETYIFGGFYYL